MRPSYGLVMKQIYLLESQLVLEGKVEASHGSFTVIMDGGEGWQMAVPVHHFSGFHVTTNCLRTNITSLQYIP